MSVEVPYTQKTERWFEVLVGGFLLFLAGGFGYFSVIGLWEYLQGSTADPASPWGWGIGLPVAVWLVLVSRRLVLGVDRDRPLISDRVLLAGAICAFILAGLVVPLGLFLGGGIRAVYAAPILVMIGYSALSFRKQRGPGPRG